MIYSVSGEETIHCMPTNMPCDFHLQVLWCWGKVVMVSGGDTLQDTHIRNRILVGRKQISHSPKQAQNRFWVQTLRTVSWLRKTGFDLTDLISVMLQAAPAWRKHDGEHGGYCSEERLRILQRKKKGNELLMFQGLCHWPGSLLLGIGFFLCHKT